LEPADHVLVAPGRERRFEPVLDGVEPLLAEKARLAQCERLVPRVAERVAGPQRERLVEHGERSSGVARPKKRAPLAGEPGEQMGVDVLGTRPEHVAARHRLEQVACAECVLEEAAHLRDRDAHPGRRRRRRVVAPQRVGELLRRDTRARIEQEVGEHRLLTHAGRGGGAMLGPHPDGAEDAEPDPRCGGGRAHRERV
jgi:hypothetical protein